ncbi:MAG: divergent PAP2 family protein [Chloroflexi bacterium]|nr:MAG: divergent PAP2 family protein [Chloroflexota bacterium]TME15528.1 MAG: divergent PAP2 family protein [Chloroflexota bacterium]TME18276.1 MAG: divergent PAP2 family protein [Chloroflexota bacterium]
MSLRYIVLPLIAWAIAQGTKVVLDSLRHRRLYLRGLAEMGGMPSSHTAMVAALTTTIGRFNGISNAFFAIALIFSFVVMYDAAGVRRAAGRQAVILNRLVDDLFAQRGVREEGLRELLGHTPFEVFVGAGLGIAVGLLVPA